MHFDESTDEEYPINFKITLRFFGFVRPMGFRLNYKYYSERERQQSDKTKFAWLPENVPIRPNKKKLFQIESKISFIIKHTKAFQLDILFIKSIKKFIKLL